MIISIFPSKLDEFRAVVVKFSSPQSRYLSFSHPLTRLFPFPSHTDESYVRRFGQRDEFYGRPVTDHHDHIEISVTSTDNDDRNPSTKPRFLVKLSSTLRLVSVFPLIFSVFCRTCYNRLNIWPQLFPECVKFLSLYTYNFTYFKCILNWGVKTCINTCINTINTYKRIIAGSKNALNTIIKAAALARRPIERHFARVPCGGAVRYRAPFFGRRSAVWEKRREGENGEEVARKSKRLRSRGTGEAE